MNKFQPNENPNGNWNSAIDAVGLDKTFGDMN